MTTSKLAAVLALNLLFFTTVHSSWNTPPPPWNTPPPPVCPPPPSCPPPPVCPPPPSCPACPPPPVCPPPSCPPVSPPTTPPVSPPTTPPVSPPTTPPVSPPTTPPVSPPTTPPVSPPHPPTPPPPVGSCPINVLQFAVCASVLNLVKLHSPVVPGGQNCCALISPLIDADAAVCLCLAAQANLLGISVNPTVDVTLLLNYCGKTCPPDFTCPN